MKAYCAGKTHALHEVQVVQRLLRVHGYEITWDWTKVVEEVGGPAHERGVSPEQQAQFAMRDAQGVFDADVVTVNGHPHLCGTLIEFGMALAWKKPVWLIGYPHTFARESVFFHLPNVKKFRDLLAFEDFLRNEASITYAERGLKPSRMVVRDNL